MPESSAVGTFERILYLKRNSPQRLGLSTAELSVVAEQMRERSFRRGSVILREGDPVSALHFLVRGSVRVAHRGRPLGRVGPGATLGTGGILSKEPWGLQVDAESDVLALELDADVLLEILEDHFPLLLELIRDATRQNLDFLSSLTDLPEDFFSERLEPFEFRERDLVERILAFRHAGPFKRSSINALAELAQGMSEVSFDQGVTLWEQGDASGMVLLLVKGRVRCLSTRPGGSFRFGLGPGMPLGVVESIPGERRWFTPVTETKVIALQQDVEGLIDLFEDNFGMATDYLGWIQGNTLALIESVGSDDKLLEFLVGRSPLVDDSFERQEE
jgi:CRP-like cAMP-binding protein